MAFGIVAFTRAKSGAYTARKAIPKDVREEFANSGGVGKPKPPRSFQSAAMKTNVCFGKSGTDIEARLQAIGTGAVKREGDRA